MQVKETVTRVYSHDSDRVHLSAQTSPGVDGVLITLHPKGTDRALERYQIYLAGPDARELLTILTAAVNPHA